MGCWDSNTQPIAHESSQLHYTKAPILKALMLITSEWKDDADLKRHISRIPALSRMP